MKDEESVLVVDYKERFIWLDGGISSIVAYQFKRMITKLNKSGVGPIVFYISGPGGDTHAGFSMINEISNSDNPVVTVAHGILSSGCFTITQAGAYRLTLPGSKFVFHPAELQFSKNLKHHFQMTQNQLLESLERLRLVDSVQLSWFLKKGRPTRKIFDLLRDGATISSSRAIDLNLMDGYYKTSDFLKDRRIARKLIKAQ